jgi:hypothetical protein
LIVLEGPSWSGPQGEGVGLCGEIYSIVAAARDHISLLRGQYTWGIVGYHPDDTEEWYLTGAACEAAAAAASASGKKLLAAGDHVHRMGGC